MDKGTFRGSCLLRDEFLKLIGFDCYASYLKSSLWEWVRSSLESQDNAKSCYCCGCRTGLQWHHRSYEPWILVGNFSNSGNVVIRVCAACHAAIHKDFPPLHVTDMRLALLAKLLREGVSHVDAVREASSSDDRFKEPSWRELGRS